MEQVLLARQATKEGREKRKRKEKDVPGQWRQPSHLESVEDCRGSSVLGGHSVENMPRDLVEAGAAHGEVAAHNRCKLHVKPRREHFRTALLKLLDEVSGAHGPALPLVRAIQGQVDKDTQLHGVMGLRIYPFLCRLQHAVQVFDAALVAQRTGETDKVQRHAHSPSMPKCLQKLLVVEELVVPHCALNVFECGVHARPGKVRLPCLLGLLIDKRIVHKNKQPVVLVERPVRLRRISLL